MGKLNLAATTFVMFSLPSFAEAATWQERALGKAGFVIGLGALVFIIPVIWKAVFRNKK
ncbi:MAG: hypothetical protein ACJ0BH_05220 [Candidatus Puniceispirillaceae bacterium]